MARLIDPWAERPRNPSENWRVVQDKALEEEIIDFWGSEKAPEPPKDYTPIVDDNRGFVMLGSVIAYGGAGLLVGILIGGLGFYALGKAAGMAMCGVAG